MRSVRAAAGLGSLGFLSLAACIEPVYLPESRPLETVTAEHVLDGPALFIDSDLYVLPVRQPTQKEAAALQAEQQKRGLPMPVPWLGERDVDIEIEWSIKNLDAQVISSRLTINGGNEFGDYVKTLYADPNDPDQPPAPELLGSDELIAMDAGSVRSGVFREDELREAGLDLEVITRYPPPNAGLNAPFIAIEHNSTASSVGLENIPKGDVTPAMVRFAIVLEATGRAALDYVVRVREKGSPGDKLALDGHNLYVSTAAVLPAPVQPTPAVGATDD